MILPQIPYAMAHYKAGQEVFKSIQEAAKSIGEVSINKTYISRNWTGWPKRNVLEGSLDQNSVETYSQATMFNEISAVLPELHPRLYTMLESPSCPKPGGSLAGRVYKDICNYLVEYWDDSKVHVMPHSSGYDSRVISGIIKKLGLKGEIYYICIEPEVDEFLKIADYMDWSKKSIVSVQDRPRDYFADVLDFDYIGAHWSEVSRCIVSEMLIYATIENIVKNLRLKLSDIQFVTATRFDETFLRNWSVGNLLRNYFSGSLDIKNEFGAIIVPFTSLDVMDTMMNFVMSKKGKGRLKVQLMELIDPGLLKLGRHSGRPGEFFRVSGAVTENITHKVKVSWWAKTFKRMPVPTKKHYIISGCCNSMCEYVKAAICEHLVKSEVKISV